SSVQGWADLDARFCSYNRLKSPVMVATFYGPSGSGKSTIFKNLTGVEVPAGGAIRPCSMACAAAVPEALCSNLVVGDLFPMHAPLPLESPAQIRSPSGPGQI
ncbi:MAG: ATP-binding cassette domain-containing protein, partial [Planctomycetia bacterium]